MINALEGIKQELNNIEELDIKDFKKENTAIIVIDMIRGFYDIGSLASNRVGHIIENLKELNNKTYGFKKVFFIDYHDETSSEFSSYPKHCIGGTLEAELIEELKPFSKEENSKVIYKNSINGFHAEEFKKWLDKNLKIDNFIVTGVCTDICVETFVISLITYFNEKNLNKKIIVPANCVETFHLGNHHGDLMNLISLYKMKSNGVHIVKL